MAFSLRGWTLRRNYSLKTILRSLIIINDIIIFCEISLLKFIFDKLFIENIRILNFFWVGLSP